MGAVRRPHATTLLLSLLLAALLALGPHPAGAQESTTTTVVPSGDIIPEPNSGAEPEDAGDRGGALQTVLFLGLIVVVAGAGWFLVAQSRRARADRGY